MGEYYDLDLNEQEYELLGIPPIPDTRSEKLAYYEDGED